MTRKRSKLKAKTHRTKAAHKTRTIRPRTRKTQKGGSTQSRIKEALRIAAGAGVIRQVSLHKLTIAGVEINDHIDDTFSQGAKFPEIPLEGLIRTYSGISKKDTEPCYGLYAKTETVTCSSITQVDLDILSQSLCDVQCNFDKQLTELFEAERSLGNQAPNKAEPRLYRLFYQIMTVEDLKAMIKHLLPGYDPTHPTKLTDAFRNKRFAELVHSYKYKIFAGIATKYAMTETVLSYTTPGGGSGVPPPPPPGGGLGVPPPRPPGGGLGVQPPPLPFSELRNLCLVMRDILGLINFLFRQELTNRLGAIGDTQYCHSGGNMFYVMAMMLCYIHTRHYQGDAYRAVPGYDPNDILDQIMFTFDMALGDEKECFYRYLHELMKNCIFSGLLAKITASMSDLDFLCLTSLDDLLMEPNREIMKDITYLMCGILLEHCGIGMATRTPNIALNVILPNNQPKYPICGPFSQSRRSTVEARIKGQVDAILSPYLPLLNGIKLSTNKINILKIFLVRIKVAMEQPSMEPPKPCISDELRKIFGEKLDFVIGSLQSPFYCYKQCKFFNCDYYSLETFIHELKEILTTSHDDKSDKRDARYQFFNILSYIDNHKNPAYCSAENIKIVVDRAIVNSIIKKEKAEEARKGEPETKRVRGIEKKDTDEDIEKPDICERECHPVDGREPGSRGEGGGGIGICWFNLLFGIIFQFLDPTTKNKSAEGCVNTCDDIPPGPPRPPSGPPSGPPPNPPNEKSRLVLLRRALSENGQFQAISQNLGCIRIDFTPTLFDDQLRFSIEEMRRLQEEMIPITEWSQNIFRYLIDFLPNRSELVLGSLGNAENLRGEVQLLVAKRFGGAVQLHPEVPGPPELDMRDTRLNEDLDSVVIASKAEVEASTADEEEAVKSLAKARKAALAAEEAALAAEEATRAALKTQETIYAKSNSRTYASVHNKVQAKTRKYQTTSKTALAKAKRAEETYSAAQVTEVEAKEGVVQANAEMERAWMDAKTKALDAARSLSQHASDSRETAKQYALSAKASAEEERKKQYALSASALGMAESDPSLATSAPEIEEKKNEGSPLEDL